MSSQKSSASRGAAKLPETARVVALCGLGICLLAALWHHLQKDQRPALRKRYHFGLMRMSNEQGFTGMMSHHERRSSPVRDFPPPVASRYIANFAASAGPYAVSVQQVFLAGGMQLYQNPSYRAQAGFPAPIYLGIQAVSSRPDTLTRLRSLAGGLIVRDDAGRRLRVRQISAMQTFPNGCVQWVELESASPSARALKSVEGEIRTSDSPGQNENAPAHLTQARFASASRPYGLKFQIDNVALPIARHIFGVSAAHTLSPKFAAQAHRLSNYLPDNSARLIVGGKTDALRSLFPPEAPAPGLLHLPTRLILLPDSVNHFDIPISDDNANQIGALQCSVTPALNPGGEFALRLTLRRPNAAAPLLQTNLNAWDDTPLILLLPGEKSAQGVARRPLAVWLHLFLEMPPLDHYPQLPTIAPFAAASGERSGAIEGRILIGDEPFGLGHVRLDVTRLNINHRAAVHLKAHGPADTQSVIITEPLDRDGHWLLTNIAPGAYRVRLLNVLPYSSPVADPIDPADYLRRRYGLSHVRWQRQTQGPINVQTQFPRHAPPLASRTTQ